MERRFADGQRVRVVKGVLKDQCGCVQPTIEDGEPSNCRRLLLEDGRFFLMPTDYLAPFSPIHEVVGVVDDCGWLNRTEPNWPSFIFIGTHLAGKRIKLTVEELPDE